MTFRIHTIAAHAAAITLVASVAPAQDSTASQDDRITQLQRQVAELTHEVQALRAARQQPWLDEQRAEEVRAIVHDVLADADLRASLLQSGVLAGHDGGFYIQSADGNYRLNMSGYLQTRFVANMQEGDAIDEDRYGFDVRRTRVSFTGHAVDPRWRYAVQLSGGTDGDFTASDAYIDRDLGNGWSMQVGQFKVPFLHESLMSAKRQLAADRSLVESAFGLDRTQGVMAAYEGDALRAYASINDGGDRKNTPALDADTEFAAAARAEWLLHGEWRALRDFTSRRGSEPAVRIGGAVHVEREEFGAGITDDEVESLSITGDLQLEFGGANAFASIVHRRLESDAMDADQIGIVVQGGVMLNDDWELFARYTFGDADMTGIDDLEVITVGANWFIDGHDLKWTSDIGFALDEIDSYWASGTRGWRADESDEDGQVVIRSQLQLVF